MLQTTFVTEFFPLSFFFLLHASDLSECGYTTPKSKPKAGYWVDRKIYDEWYTSIPWSGAEDEDDEDEVVEAQKVVQQVVPEAKEEVVQPVAPSTSTTSALPARGTLAFEEMKSERLLLLVQKLRAEAKGYKASLVEKDTVIATLRAAAEGWVSTGQHDTVMEELQQLKSDHATLQSR
jgi:hypothetical protein